MIIDNYLPHFNRTTIQELKIEKGTEANVLDAAAQGASMAVMLVLNIAASLIAFLSFVAFLNAIIGKQKAIPSLKMLPKLRNFAKSGHTVTNTKMKCFQ